MFLTQEQLVELTGRKRPTAIARQLAVMGIRYAIAADRWPRVMALEVERVFCTPAEKTNIFLPDADALTSWQETH